MTGFIVAFCLLLQEGDASGQKAKGNDESNRETNDASRNRLDALQKKVEQLEAELNEFKKSPAKSEGAKTPGPNKPAQGQDPGAKPNPQDQEEEKKRKQLEEEFKKALGQEKPAPKLNTPVMPQAPIGGGATLKLIDIAFDLLANGGTSSATEDELRLLQAGGHDPKNRGFTLQNAELKVRAVRDSSAWFGIRLRSQPSSSGQWRG